MGRTFQRAGVTALIVACLAAVAAFWYTHRGYPDVVYYERVVLAGPALQPPVQQVEMWVDPDRNLELRRTSAGAFRDTSLIDQQGRHVREYGDGGILITDQWFTADQAASQRADWQQLAHGGFRALANYRLADAVGPVARVLLDGRAALRFDTARHDGETQRLTVWVDARTHDPLQLRVQAPAYDYTQRLVSARRIDPGTLPADFFDPPHPADAFWNQAVAWLRGHVGGQPQS